MGIEPEENTVISDLWGYRAQRQPEARGRPPRPRLCRHLAKYSYSLRWARGPAGQREQRQQRQQRASSEPPHRHMRRGTSPLPCKRCKRMGQKVSSPSRNPGSSGSSGSFAAANGNPRSANGLPWLSVPPQAGQAALNGNAADPLGRVLLDDAELPADLPGVSYARAQQAPADSAVLPAALLPARDTSDDAELGPRLLRRRSRTSQLALSGPLAFSPGSIVLDICDTICSFPQLYTTD